MVGRVVRQPSHAQTNQPTNHVISPAHPNQPTNHDVRPAQPSPAQPTNQPTTVFVPAQPNQPTNQPRCSLLPPSNARLASDEPSSRATSPASDHVSVPFQPSPAKPSQPTSQPRYFRNLAQANQPTNHVISPAQPNQTTNHVFAPAQPSPAQPTNQPTNHGICST